MSNNAVTKHTFTKRLSMNKYLMAVLLPCSFLGAAQAEETSAVTIYGRVSGGVDYINHVALPAGGTGSKVEYGANKWGPSFLGLKGSEDLGGGLKAVFNLENMFSAGDGAVFGGGLWNRYAVVGFSSSSWGTVLLGRAMTLVDAELWALDPFGMQTTSIGTLVNFRNSGSPNNAITYNSPEFGGLSFRLQGELGEKAGDSKANRGLAGTVSYTAGNLTMKAVYEELRDATGNFSNLYANSKEYAFGGKYALKDLTLFAGVSRITSDDHTVADRLNPTASTKNQMYWLGATYQITPALNLIGAAYRANLNRGGGSATLYAVGADYFLSKRTMLYTTIGSVANKGAADFSVHASGPQPLPGSNQQTAYAGMMHWF